VAAPITITSMPTRRRIRDVREARLNLGSGPRTHDADSPLGQRRRVLLVGGLTAHLHGEAADVVGDIALQRGDLRAELEPFASLRMLNSWVLACGYSSPGVGIESIHVRGHRIQHHPAVGAAPGPLRNRIREVLRARPPGASLRVSNTARRTDGHSDVDQAEEHERRG